MHGFSLFTSLYALAKRSGFIDTRVGSELFISAYFQYKKHLEDPFDAFVRRYPHLFHGGHILDIGANIGYCAALFSRVVDSGRSVFAFEPEPFNSSLLERVIRTRVRGSVVPVQTAVGAKEGKITLKLNPQHHGDHRVLVGTLEQTDGSIVVPLMTVDGFLERQNARTPVCFIKIDVQGYELAVCEGAQETLERNPNCCLVLEYMPEALEALGYRPGDLLAWFQQRGYSSYILHRNGNLTPGPPSGTGARGYVDLLFSRQKITV